MSVLWVEDVSLPIQIHGTCTLQALHNYYLFKDDGLFLSSKALPPYAGSFQHTER